MVISDTDGETSARGGLRTTPPGFSRGFRFGHEELEDDDLANMDKGLKQFSGKAITQVAITTICYSEYVANPSHIQDEFVNVTNETALSENDTMSSEIDELLPTSVSAFLSIGVTGWLLIHPAVPSRDLI